MHLDGCFLEQFYFGYFSEWRLLKDSCKDMSLIYLEILGYTHFTFFTVTNFHGFFQVKVSMKSVSTRK